MEAATNNFDKLLLIRRGPFFSTSNRVYIGKIDGASTKVTIKHVDEDIYYFHNLIQLMSKLRHGHLVPLIGYCQDEQNNRTTMLLVYEYMARGNLWEYLYGSQKPPLTWKQRMETCIGVARGLRYLHESQVTHGDLTTANIQLDEEWLAKISNISLPKAVSSSTFVTTGVYGTVGYLDPEYFRTGQATEKSDVYSFGVVLLEVLCARPVIEPELSEEEISLVSWALRCQEAGKLEQIVDPYLKGKINPQCFGKFVKTAEKCLAFSGIDRPSMGEVILELECALQLQEGVETSEAPAAGSMSDDAMDEGVVECMDFDDLAPGKPSRSSL